jgi:hypothetical protein
MNSGVGIWCNGEWELKENNLIIKGSRYSNVTGGAEKIDEVDIKFNVSMRGNDLVLESNGIKSIFKKSKKSDLLGPDVKVIQELNAETESAEGIIEEEI